MDKESRTKRQLSPNIYLSIHTVMMRDDKRANKQSTYACGSSAVHLRVVQRILMYTYRSFPRIRHLWNASKFQSRGDLRTLKTYLIININKKCVYCVVIFTEYWYMHIGRDLGGRYMVVYYYDGVLKLIRDPVEAQLENGRKSIDFLTT